MGYFARGAKPGKSKRSRRRSAAEGEEAGAQGVSMPDNRAAAAQLAAMQEAADGRFGALVSSGPVQLGAAPEPKAFGPEALPNGFADALLDVTRRRLEGAKEKAEEAHEVVMRPTTRPAFGQLERDGEWQHAYETTKQFIPVAEDAWKAMGGG